MRALPWALGLPVVEPAWCRRGKEGECWEPAATKGWSGGPNDRHVDAGCSRSVIPLSSVASACSGAVLRTESWVKLTSKGENSKAYCLLETGTVLSSFWKRQNRRRPCPPLTAAAPQAPAPAGYTENRRRFSVLRYDITPVNIRRCFACPAFLAFALFLAYSQTGRCPSIERESARARSTEASAALGVSWGCLRVH